MKALYVEDISYVQFESKIAKKRTARRGGLVWKKNPGFRAAQDLAHLTHHIFIHFVKGRQVATIPPLATLFSYTIPFVRHSHCYVTMSICYVISSMKHSGFCVPSG